MSAKAVETAPPCQRGFTPPHGAGFTLVELLLGTGLLLGAGGALLIGMQQAMIHTDYLSQFHVAMNTAEGELERLSAVPVTTLWTDNTYAAARAGAQTTPLASLPNGQMAVQIRSADVRMPTNPNLVDLHVAVCWRSRGRSHFTSAGSHE